MTRPSLIVYGHPLSGHVHRVELFLSLLGLPFSRQLVELSKGEHRQPAFLNLYPLGQIPVLDDGGLILADSNAILIYLATKYGDGSWLPRDPIGAAQVQRWLSLASGELVQGPALARIAVVFGQGDAKPHQEKSGKLLAFMEGHLQSHHFLVGEQRTVADVALYSYITLAPEGQVPLTDYPAIRAWLGRVEALPGFLPMVVAREFLAKAG